VQPGRAARFQGLGVRSAASNLVNLIVKQAAAMAIMRWYETRAGASSAGSLSKRSACAYN
jgi:hypothetical protein